MTRTSKQHALLAAILGAGLAVTAAHADAPPVRASAGDAVGQAVDQRERILADLYARYGGGDTTRQLNDENARKQQRDHDLGHDVGRDVSQGVGRVVADIDRATFDAQCRRVGRGDKPILASDRQNDFFARTEVRDQCENVARLDLQIDQMRAHGGSR
jgi:hypothetical protein